MGIEYTNTQQCVLSQGICVTPPRRGEPLRVRVRACLIGSERSPRLTRHTQSVCDFTTAIAIAQSRHTLPSLSSGHHEAIEASGPNTNSLNENDYCILKPKACIRSRLLPHCVCVVAQCLWTGSPVPWVVARSFELNTHCSHRIGRANRVLQQPHHFLSF